MCLVPISKFGYTPVTPVTPVIRIGLAVIENKVSEKMEGLKTDLTSLVKWFFN